MTIVAPLAYLLFALAATKCYAQCQLCEFGEQLENPDFVLPNGAGRDFGINTCQDVNDKVLDDMGYNIALALLGGCTNAILFAKQLGCQCSAIPPSTSPAPSISSQPSLIPTFSLPPSISPSSEPTNSPSDSAFPTRDSTCNLCPDGGSVLNPNVFVYLPRRCNRFYGYSCGSMEHEARDFGFYDEEECAFYQKIFEPMGCHCSEPPTSSTSSPSMMPSTTPTLRPTNVESNADTTEEAAAEAERVPGCFSENTLVEEATRGSIPIAYVRIGDHILTSSDGIYEVVYSLGHYSPMIQTEYVRIQVKANFLEVTSDHMIFTADSNAVAAKFLRPGDKILLSGGDTAAIIDIQAIVGRGLFAPFTPSGKIVVNGIVASTFTDVDWPFVSGQWVAHTFEAPHRWAVTHFRLFDRFETHAANGMSNWVAGAAEVSFWIRKQHLLLQGIAYIVAVTILCIVSCLSNTWIISALCTGIYTAVVWNANRNTRKNKTANPVVS